MGMDKLCGICRIQVATKDDKLFMCMYICLDKSVLNKAVKLDLLNFEPGVGQLGLYVRNHIVPRCLSLLRDAGCCYAVQF